MPVFIRTSLALSALLTVSGCGGESSTSGGNDNKAPIRDASFDTTADKASIAEHWVVKAAQDPSALNAIGQSSGGWPALMQNQTMDALRAFEGDLKGKPDDLSLKIGAARAALELAEAHLHLAEIVLRGTPTLLKAQTTLPGTEQAAPWARYIQQRIGQYERSMGVTVKKATSDVPVPPESPAAPWLAGIKADAVGPVADLLAGRAGGADASPPAGAEAVYGDRLRLKSLVAAGRLKEARKRMERINPAIPDIRIKLDAMELTFLDPFALQAQGHVYAAVALGHLEGAEGFAQMLRARALALLGQHEEAITAADAVIAAKGEIPLAMLLFSSVGGVEDLRAEASSLKARALRASGHEEQGRKVLDAMKKDTIPRRVSHALAAVKFDLPVGEDVFPEDRSVLEGLVAGAIPKGAAGAQVVADLMLIDRYVDSIQRRYADALQGSDKRAWATKVRAGAEGKAKALAPSTRNTLSALTAAALDNVQIGQPRVAVKYLNRMKDHLPAVKAPMEMLRDVLAIRAVNQGGGKDAPVPGQ